MRGNALKENVRRRKWWRCKLWGHLFMEWVSMFGGPAGSRDGTSLKLCQMVHLFQLRTGGDSFTYWHVLMSCGLVFWQENWHTRGIVVKIVKTSVCVCVCAKKNVTHRLLITHLFESESLAWTTRQSQHNSVFLACSLKKKRNRKSDFNDLTVIITCHAWLR